jgi:hypothetical protein
MKKLIPLMLGIAIVLSGCGDATDGEKIGTFVRLHQTGFFCKTWEAEIIRGGMNGGSGVAGAAFDITIENPELLEKVKGLMESQTEVKITYHQERFTWCRSESADNFLTSIVEQSRKATHIDTTVSGDVTVHQETQSESDARTHDEKVNQLLKIQAELIEELSKGK